MKVILISSGKGQVLSGKVDADLYIDCRGINNPHRDPEIGHLTGDDPKVHHWLLKHNFSYATSAMEMILTALNSAQTRNSFKASPDKPLTVCFFCLAGVHRSRGMKHVVGKLLRGSQVEVEIV